MLLSLALDCTCIRCSFCVCACGKAALQLQPLEEVTLEVLRASTSCCSVLCGCPSAFGNDEVRSLCRAFPEAFVLRCFAFEPSDAQVEVDTSAREHLIMFPPARSGQRCSRPQERCPCP